jgi:hypothetical protein
MISRRHRGTERNEIWRLSGWCWCGGSTLKSRIQPKRKAFARAARSMSMRRWVMDSPSHGQDRFRGSNACFASRGLLSLHAARLLTCEAARKNAVNRRVEYGRPASRGRRQGSRNTASRPRLNSSGAGIKPAIVAEWPAGWLVNVQVLFDRAASATKSPSRLSFVSRVVP